MAKYTQKEIPEHINTTNENPFKILMWLLTSLAMFFVVLSISLKLSEKFLGTVISKKKEIKWLQDKEIIAINKNQKKNDSLTKHLLDLWKNNGHDNLNLKMFTLNDKIPNAMTSLGGNFYVTKGLLKNIQNKNALSFVFCHELGHFQHRHIIQGALIGLGLAGLGSIINIKFFDSILNLNNLKFSRDKEREADKYAMDCINKTYGHVNGYEGFFNSIKELEKLEAIFPVIEFTRTHPISKNRIDDLKDYAIKKNYSLKGDLTPYKYIK